VALGDGRFFPTASDPVLCMGPADDAGLVAAGTLQIESKPRRLGGPDVGGGRCVRCPGRQKPLLCLTGSACWARLRPADRLARCAFAVVDTAA